jgi:hypothetical protein
VWILNWSFALRKEQRLSVLEKSDLKILGLRGSALSEGGEDCIVRSFIIFTHPQVL